MLCKPHPLVGIRLLPSLECGGLSRLGGTLTIMVNHCVAIGCKITTLGKSQASIFFIRYYSPRLNSVPNHPLIAICIFPPVGEVFNIVELVYSLASFPVHLCEGGILKRNWNEVSKD